MKRPLSQAAFDTYVANRECAAYLASDILEKRLRQLLRLIADGEKFTVCEAADFVFLPSEVFNSYGPKYSPPSTKRQREQWTTRPSKLRLVGGQRCAWARRLVSNFAKLPELLIR